MYKRQISGILLTIIGILLAPQILIWMKTPADVLPNSILYFRIYFLGSPAFVLYTHFVGILQSVGDSRHPLYYLIFSSLVNIVLDLLFVGVFHMGVGAAAAATIISQFLSAALCLYLSLIHICGTAGGGDRQERRSIYRTVCHR